MTGATTSPTVHKEFVSSESPGAKRAGAGGYPCQGLYYTPAGKKPRIAMIATHYVPRSRPLMLCSSRHRNTTVASPVF